MSERVYAVRFVRPVVGGEPGEVAVLEDNVRAVLDGDDPRAVAYWMGRLLYGCADRHGLHRDQAHLIVAEVQGVDRDGYLDPDSPLTRWVLPMPEDT